MGTVQSNEKTQFDKMKESENENDVNLRFKNDPFQSKNSIYDKSNMKQDWANTDFSKDDSIKPLDMPTGYDTVYKEPESNNSIIIILVIILVFGLSSAGGAAFIFMQKKS